MKKSDILFYLLNIIIPLLIGTCIYLWCSPNVIFVKFIQSFVQVDLKILVECPKFLRNYLSDFCWSYALAFAISLIYYEKISILTSIIIPTSVGIGLELLQLFRLIGGTYDFIDIFYELIASLLCFIILKIRNDKEEIS